jgi:DNA-binding response OmpR family regulator
VTGLVFLGALIWWISLLEHVWGEEYASEHHLLIVNINRVRHKVEPDPAHPIYIITRKGIGYLMPTHRALARQVSGTP